MKKFILPCIIIALTSCQQPTIPVVEESITITEPEIIEEELIMERTFTMKSIPDMLGYLFKNGFLRGITAETARRDFTPIRVEADIDGKLALPILDDFFTKDGKKYFSVTDRYMENETEMSKEHYFEQTGESVKEIEIIPDKPADPKMLIGKMGVFEFTTYKWEKLDYNKLSFIESGAIISTAKGFDSAVLTDTGILFSQPETLSRESGLWFMGNEQKGGPTRISDYQIIY